MRPHPLRSSIAASKKRASDARKRANELESASNRAHAYGFLEGIREAELRFTKLLRPEHGRVFLSPPPEKPLLAVPIPQARDLALFEPMTYDVPIRACLGVVHFRAVRMAINVGNGVIGEFFTWEPDGFTANPEVVR